MNFLRNVRSGIGASSRSGLTLLEILLVLALLGMLTTTVTPSLSRIFRANVSSSVRRFSGLIRFTYDQAVMTGRLHRIVLDLDNASWKVESADPGALPIDRTRLGLMAEGLREEDRQLTEPGFKPAGKGLVDDIPRGVKIVEVKSWRIGPDPVDKGTVSIYAFPNGYVDEATIVLSEADKENVSRYEISTLPLTGRVVVNIQPATAGATVGGPPQ